MPRTFVDVISPCFKFQRKMWQDVILKSSGRSGALGARKKHGNLVFASPVLANMSGGKHHFKNNIQLNHRRYISQSLLQLARTSTAEVQTDRHSRTHDHTRAADVPSANPNQYLILLSGECYGEIPNSQT